VKPKNTLTVFVFYLLMPLKELGTISATYGPIFNESLS
jgi:hypothetical protein